MSNPERKNAPDERERIVAYLMNEARLAEPYQDGRASVLATMARSIEAGVHWSDMETEPRIYDPFRDDAS